MATSKHDLFFSASLEHPAIAKDFIHRHIPAHLKDLIDWDNFDRADRTNTDPSLKRRHRDIIFKLGLNNKQEENIILAVEHQSEYDPMLPIRYLRYTTDNLERYLKEGNKKWPLVVNLLLYHGRLMPYSHGSQTTDYYENPILGNQELWFRFHIIDLTQMSDEELLMHGLCAPMKVLLKHSRDGKFELQLEAYSAIFHDCVQAVGDEYIFSMLTYASSLEDFRIGEKMYKFVEEVFQDKPEILMTYGQILQQEAKQAGIIEGIQEGIIKGMQQGEKTKAMEIAKGMLKEGLDIKVIQKITSLSIDVLEKLKKDR